MGVPGVELKGFRILGGEKVRERMIEIFEGKKKNEKFKNQN